MKKWKMTILGLAESFKTMNRPGPIVTLFDGLFLGKYKKQGREILTQSSFKYAICAINIDSLETMRFSATYQFR